MRKRLKTITGAAAAVVALALGGSALASAGQSTAIGSKHAVTKSVPREKTGGPDTDSIQSDDQTSPETHGAKASSASTPETTGSEEESSTESDGPGGHEDPAGDVEFESEAQE